MTTEVFGMNMAVRVAIEKGLNNMVISAPLVLEMALKIRQLEQSEEVKFNAAYKAGYNEGHDDSVDGMFDGCCDNQSEKAMEWLKEWNIENN
tara:strand:+ start:276 stop:551 length:276 start_codon:yes stop_codon:yes gene_type:complete